MAKRDEEKKKAEGKEEKKKKPLLLFIAIGVVLLLAAGGGAYFFLYSAPSDEELAQEIARDEMGSKKAALKTTGVMIELDSFIVNLADLNARHFLKATIVLEVVDDAAKNDVDILLPKIRNDIIMLLSSQTMEDVITMEGKVRLRDAIMARVMRILSEHQLKNIYFAQFVVQ